MIMWLVARGLSNLSSDRSVGEDAAVVSLGSAALCSMCIGPGSTEDSL